eukprot:TRINITY_DN1361_c0_g1_i1.p1 TRINITY_DN1361_c0_g1~~TRINITY_DN1361_c0_g1_i1.p1  ORF type:complete len:811 (+),score=157.39 TRINITY_DN1361_c0_g1_i1:63-2495(+)
MAQQSGELRAALAALCPDSPSSDSAPELPAPLTTQRAGSPAAEPREAPPAGLAAGTAGGTKRPRAAASPAAAGSAAPPTGSPATGSRSPTRRSPGGSASTAGSPPAKRPRPAPAGGADAAPQPTRAASGSPFGPVPPVPAPSPTRRAPPEARIVVPPAAQLEPAAAVSEACRGCRVAVVTGAALGAARGRVAARLAAKHGGVVVGDLRTATHVVSGYPTVQRLYAALGLSPAVSEARRPEFVRVEWVGACVREGRPAAAAPYTVPAGGEEPSLSPAPAGARGVRFADTATAAAAPGAPAAAGSTAAPPAGAVDNALKGGFTSVFFGTPPGAPPPAPAAPALRRPRGDPAEGAGGAASAGTPPDAGAAPAAADAGATPAAAGDTGSPPAAGGSEEPAVTGSYVGPHANRRQLAYLERRKPFACQRASLLPDPDSAPAPAAPTRAAQATPGDGGPNQHIVEELERLQKLYTGTGDHWRQYAYGRALAVVRRWRGPIRSREDLLKVQGIGSSIADKIIEIIETGSSAKRKHMEQSDEVRAVAELTGVWGIGAATALRYFRRGVRTVEDLRRYWSELSAAQQVGLRYYDEIAERIPRREVAEIELTVRRAALAINPNLEVQACGSYRRGKDTCGDVDILITDTTGRAHDGLLAMLIERLSSAGFLTAELSRSLRGAQSGKADTWFGLCRLPDCAHEAACPYPHLRDIQPQHLPEEHRTPECLRHHLNRRLDLKVYAREHYPFAVLYFTGSDYFNRSMRLYCQKKGLTLGDTALRPAVRVAKERVHDGAPIPCATERDIFAAVGLEWKEPHERNA